MFDFSIVTQWIDSLLRQTLGLGDFWSIFIECVLVGAAILALAIKPWKRFIGQMEEQAA